MCLHTTRLFPNKSPNVPVKLRGCEMPSHISYLSNKNVLQKQRSYCGPTPMFVRLGLLWAQAFLAGNTLMCRITAWTATHRWMICDCDVHACMHVIDKHCVHLYLPRLVNSLCCICSAVSLSLYMYVCMCTFVLVIATYKYLSWDEPRFIVKAFQGKQTGPKLTAEAHLILHANVFAACQPNSIIFNIWHSNQCMSILRKCLVRTGPSLN